MDGIPAEPLSVDDDDDDIQSSEDNTDTDTHSFMPFPMNEATEDEAICASVNLINFNTISGLNGFFDTLSLWTG